MGDPAAVSAALALLRAWGLEEATGRDLAARFVEEGLLTMAQVRALVGVEVAERVPAACGVGGEPASVPAGTEPSQSPLPLDTAVLSGPEPSLLPANAPDQAVGAGVPDEAEADPTSPSPAPGPRRTGRIAMFASAALGVALALAVSFPPNEAPRAGFMTIRPRVPAPAVRLLPPMPPPPAPRRPPLWPPRLRQVREGDSWAIHDRLHRIELQARETADRAIVGFDARRVLASSTPPGKDRVVAWVELTLGRYAAVAGLQARFSGVEVAWARE